MAQIEVKSSFPKAREIMGYQTLPINSKFNIALQPSTSYSELSSHKKTLIQSTWDEEQKKRGGKLHEGAILSAITFDQKGLSGQFVPYKYYFAQAADPSLKPDLQIVPISLTGMTFIQDQIIIAKRAPWVTQYPGFYELAPSGGIRPPGKDLEAVDMKLQLLDELVEETFIKSTRVKSVKFFTLVRDFKEDTVELCAEIKLKPGGLVLSSSSEYTQVMAISTHELESFVAAYKDEIVPITLVLLKLKKLIQ